MNTNIIGLVDCLNGNEDIKLWDKDKDGAFKIKTCSFKIFMFLCNFVYLQLVFFFYLSKYTQKHKTRIQFSPDLAMNIVDFFLSLPKFYSFITIRHFLRELLKFKSEIELQNFGSSLFQSFWKKNS